MRVADANHAAATVLCRALVAGGARHVFISPGSRNTPLVLAFAQCDGAVVRVVLDERAAAFMALGAARASGAPAVLVCTSGSAGGHYLPAVMEASAWGVALIVLTADRPPEHHHVGAAQTTDQQSLYGSHVRWFRDLGPPDGDGKWLRTVAAQALDYAQGVRPGPVHINAAYREPLWLPDVDAEGPFHGPVSSARVLRGSPRLDGRGLEAVAERMRRARRGVIVCGPRALVQKGAGPAPVSARADDEAYREHTEGGQALQGGVVCAAQAICDLGRHLDWPVIADACSQVRFAADDGGALVAAADALMRCDGFASACVPDFILRLGRVPTSKPLQSWLARHGEGRTVLVDPHGAWQDPDHVADVLCVAEPVRLCRALCQLLEPRPVGPWRAAFMRAETAAQRALARACGEGLWEGAIARIVAASVPSGGLLHLGSSMPVRDVDSFAPARVGPVHTFSNRGLNGIDGTLATAFGEALAWPHGPLVTLTGDLAFLHDVGGLRAAVQAGARGTVVVVSNGGGAIFDYLAIANHPTAFETYFRAPQQADIGALCSACGVAWRSIGDRSELETALSTALPSPGIEVIDVSVDSRRSYAAHQAAWQEVASELSGEGFCARGSHG